jgi:hypothetical protein
MIGALAVIALGTAFLIWLLTYCLRVGAVGSFWYGDAARDGQPIRFWTGIVGLAGAGTVILCFFFYALWVTLTGSGG